MQAMKNAAHLVGLSVWAVLGIVFSVRMLLSVEAVSPVLLFWAWFAGFAGLMTFIVTKLKSPLGALGAHGIAFLALNFVPRVMPFVLLRLGYDLLCGMGSPF